MSVSEGWAVIFAAIVGFASSSLKDALEKRSKGKRFEIALESELAGAVSQIAEKMSWLGRAIPADVSQADPIRMVTVDGQQLYLGEREIFSVSMPFWTSNYNEIVSIISTRCFRDFTDAFGLLRKFETKFSEMKVSFDHSQGDPKKMAAACYQDLKEINSQLQPMVLGRNRK